MGYFSQTKGEYQDTEDVVVFPSTTLAAEAASNGTPIEVGDLTTANLEFEVSALSAGDEVAAKIQTSKDGTGSGVGAWRDVASFTTATATGTERKSFAGLDRFIRAVVTPADESESGGVSATVSIKGELK